MKKQKVQAKINLEALAGGAFAEKLNEALMQVAENIQNPNTEATTKRQITVNIKFTPNKTRQMVGTQIAVTTKLAATEAIDTQMVMGVNMRTGQIEIAEYDGQIRGQMDLSDFTDADQDQEPEETQTMITSVFNTASTTGGSSGEGLTSTAGRLLTLDDFSLGSLADSGGVVVYYDFSGFTWSPQIQTEGTGDDADDFMAKLKAHEAEFFDWLEEFIKMREVAQYA